MFRFDRVASTPLTLMLGASAALAAFACQTAAWQAANAESRRRLASTARDLFHLLGVTLYAAALITLGFSPALAALLSGATAALQEAIHHGPRRTSPGGALLGLTLTIGIMCAPEGISAWASRLGAWAIH